MHEYVTEAVTLGVRSYGEHDRWIDLYTKNLGRIGARVIGGRRILSKLSLHLDVMNLVEVRLVRKNQFTVVDATTKDRFIFLRRDIQKHSSALRLMYLFTSLVPTSAPDIRLWHHLVSNLAGTRVHCGTFLQLLGYDPLLASCENCYAKRVHYFFPADQSFLCSGCCSRLSLNLERMLYIH